MKKRTVYLDLLRIIAAFFVIYNHNYAYNFYQTADNPVLYALSLCLSVLCKISVPVFFMISGAVLLGKKETFSDYLKKRVLKTAALLFFFSLIQNLYLCNNLRDFSFIDFLKSVYKEPAVSSYWFLYIYLSFIITLPFLRKMVSAMEDTEYVYLIILSLIFTSFFPLVEIFFSSALNMKVRILDTNLFYPLIGYFLYTRQFKFKNTKKINILLFFSSILTIAAAAAAVHIDSSIQGSFSETNISIFISVSCISLFYHARAFEENHGFSPFMRKWIPLLGQGTMGVYLINNMLRNFLMPLFDFLSLYMIDGLANFIYMVLQLLLGITVTVLFQKILQVIHIKSRTAKVTHP